MKALERRIAIVTGSSRGIGKAIAVAFAAAGANVVVTARSRADLEAVAAQIRAAGQECHAVTADLADAADIQRIADEAVRRFGRIDLLVNNAGIIHAVVDLVDFDPKLWREVMDVNLTAPALLMQAVLPNMIANRSGKIINISSIGGRQGAKGRSAYRATKAALINLTESVAAEVKTHGIDVNCICPGVVDTPGFRGTFGAQRLEQHGVMRPEEIAALALFLASDAGSSVTGTAINATGSSNRLFR